MRPEDMSPRFDGPGGPAREEAQMHKNATIRPATRADAPALARLVDMAGEELPRTIWAGMAEAGETIWDVGARRAARDEGAFSWRNATVAEIDGQVAAGLVGYRVGNTPEETEGLPAMFVPLVELENLALGSFYVNVLATFPEFRRMGLGQRLMRDVPARAGGQGPYSIIVADKNLPAATLYAEEGYMEIARRPIVEDGGWGCASDNWVLLVRHR